MDFNTGLLIFGWLFVFAWIPLVVFSQRKIHPKALFILFFAELWERFSFYGMRALLILYMTQVLFKEMGQADADVRAYGIYGAYGALVYAMPVIGGMVADRIFGFSKAIIVGGVLMALGHFALGLEGLLFEGNLMIFFVSLALIIVGNGFFKPNISSFLGTFYEQNDPRKDGAFTIFYMGVNIGGFLAPLSCAYLANEWGWHYGFGAAGIGMVIGLIVFGTQLASFGTKGLAPNPEKNKESIFAGLNSTHLVYLGIALGIPLCAFLLNVNEVMSLLLVIVGVGIIGYLLYTSFTSEDKQEGQRLLVIVVLFFFHMLFWALFEQAGGSLTLFAERNVDRVIFGSEIPTAAFASVNPLFIILLAPVFSWIWVKLNQSNREPSTPMKFVLGLAQLALGFGVIVIGAKAFSIGGTVPLIFLVVMYLFNTTGELSLSPVGLSLVTKLSPAKTVGFVMGAWFLSISFAHEIAAKLGALAASPGEDATKEASMDVFTSVYLNWGVMVIGGAALVLLLLVPTLRKWMHGIH